jgi:phosphoglycolate phosphatase
MNIKLIIFDLDGTLIDTAADITHALNYAVLPYLRKKITVEETIKLVGEGITRLIEKLLVPDRTELGPVVQDRFIQYYTEHLHDYSQPYPGVRETLDALNGYKKAVLSNKRESLSRRLLESLNLSSYFDIILGSDSVEEKKPSPKPVLQTLAMLSLRPENAIMVGDSDYDIEAGRAAGVSTVAVSYGYRDVSVLQNADFIIDDIRELPPKVTILDTAIRET